MKWIYFAINIFAMWGALLDPLVQFYKRLTDRLYETIDAQEAIINELREDLHVARSNLFDEREDAQDMTTIMTAQRELINYLIDHSGQAYTQLIIEAIDHTESAFNVALEFDVVNDDDLDVVRRLNFENI